MFACFQKLLAPEELRTGATRTQGKISTVYLSKHAMRSSLLPGGGGEGTETYISALLPRALLLFRVQC